MNPDGHRDVKVIPRTDERLVRLDFHGEIEIAHAAPPLARVSFFRHADPGAVAHARGNPDRHRLAAHLDAEAAAPPARRLLQPPRTAARVAALREHHAAAARSDDAAALAALAPRLDDVQRSGTAARLTRVAARQGDLTLRPAHRLLERQRHRGVQVGAAHGLRRVRLLPLREDFGEQIAEGRGIGVGHSTREIEPLELHGDRCRHGGERAGVVPQPPLGIAQCLVGARDLLEARFRLVVTRIDVRVKLPRQPLVGALDLDQGRRPRDA